MSASYEEIPNVGGSDCHGGGDGDEDEDDSASVDHPIGKKQSRFRKAKQVVQLQFTKAKKQFGRSKTKSGRVVVRSPSSGDTRIGSGSGTGNRCYFCILRPQVLESPNGPPTSDPNDPNFTHAMLRALIEKNNFYSKECNPHVD